MPLLFSYGTLQGTEVQRAIFGRAVESRPDALDGHVLTRVRVRDPQFAAASGFAVHASLRHTGQEADRVSGRVLEVTGAELSMADAYEARAEYRRKPVRLTSGEEAWVYVHQGEPA